VTSGFRSDVYEICVLLPCYVAYSGNYLPTFRDNLPGPIFKKSWISLSLKMGSDMSPPKCR